MKLSRLGEFGLIDRIERKIPRTDKSVIKGIGDDAAVVTWDKKRYMLITQDMLIEGVHFRLKTANAFKIGHKSLACGLSDIAAMGGAPKYALISLGLPKNLSVKFVDGLYSGITALAKKFGVNIIGGDTNASQKIVIDVNVIGYVDKEKLVTRSGAMIKDMIFITGSLGGSGRGRHLTFIPRLKEAQYLVRNFKISSMIDLSDGLSSDLSHITAQSKTGAVIYKELIPVNRGCSLKDALGEGEDFELLFTMPLWEAKKVIEKKNTFKIGKTTVTAIGQIVDKDFGCLIIDRNGNTQKLTAKGFRHF